MSARMNARLLLGVSAAVITACGGAERQGPQEPATPGYVAGKKRYAAS